MASIRVLLIVSPGPARDSFMEELAHLPAVVDVVESITQIEETLVDTPYNGILLDVPTLIRASGEQKRKSQILLDFFPVLRLTFRPHLSPNKGLTDGQTPSRTSTIAEFLAKDCAAFTARPMRSCQRCPVTLNVLVLPTADSPESSGAKAYTVNMSMTGCFIATPEPPECGRTVFLVFADFADRSPVEVEVCWRLPWGEAKRVPGFGARFIGLRDDSHKELHLLIKDTHWVAAEE